MQENVVANRVFGQVFPLLGDAKALIETRLTGVADRILMPLPEKALQYLPCAVSAVKPSGGWLHVHVFEHAKKTECAADKAMARIAEVLGPLGVAFEFGLVREVRSVGPNWSQIVVDVRVLP
jgi:tRNA (guanine37-N1)-methyltransferase